MLYLQRNKRKLNNNRWNENKIYIIYKNWNSHYYRHHQHPYHRIERDMLSLYRTIIIYHKLWFTWSWTMTRMPSLFAQRSRLRSSIALVPANSGSDLADLDFAIWRIESKTQNWRLETMIFFFSFSLSLRWRWNLRKMILFTVFYLKKRKKIITTSFY